MVLTTVLLVVSTVALPVDTGTTSPTWSDAVWLLITTNDGFDNTLTLVTVCKASRMALGCASDPIRKLKPGKARLMNALVTAPAAAATPVAVVVPVEAAVVTVGACVDCVLRIEPLSGLRPRFLLVRKACTP